MSGQQINPPNDEKQKPLQLGEVYAPLVELAIHGQDNKLNLFSSFLFFQSILLLAWATVWQMDKVDGRHSILVLLSVFGSLSSVVWAVLGSDYADASDLYGCVAKDLEQYLPPVIKRHPLTERHGQRKVKGAVFASKRLIKIVTLGFACLYPLLELTVYWKGFVCLICG